MRAGAVGFSILFVIVAFWAVGIIYNKPLAMDFLIDKKVKFEPPDGSIGKSPSNGTTLFAAGPRAVEALIWADESGLGQAMCRAQVLYSRKAA